MRNKVLTPMLELIDLTNLDDKLQPSQHRTYLLRSI